MFQEAERLLFRPWKEEDAEELKNFGNNNPFVSFQDEYSLACRKNETEMFRFRDEYAMTPFTWGSLGQGILSGKIRGEAWDKVF